MESGKNKKVILRTGMVIEAFRGLQFKVRLDDGHEILAHLAGKLRIFHIKILPGDRVTVGISPYDEKRGRIVFRGR